MKFIRKTSDKIWHFLTHTIPFTLIWYRNYP